MGVIVNMYKVLRSAWKRMTESKVRAYNHNDFNANFASAITITGAKLGVNTSAEGYIYVRLVADGGDWDVNLYTAPAASGLVAAANAVADGAVATCTEQNSSGLTVTVTLDASVVAEIDDVHRILVYPDFSLQVDDKFDGDIDRDPEMERVLTDARAAIADQLSQALSVVDQAFIRFMQIQMGPAVKSGYSESGLMLSREPADDDGAISVAFTGLLEDLRLGSKNNNSGGALPQEVVKAVLSVAAASYESGNVGAGTTPTATVYEHQEGGTWTFVCTKDDIGQQEFTASFSPSDTARAHLSYVSPIPLRVKREWKDPGEPPGTARPRIGLKSLTIDYARTITNVSGTAFNTTNTLWSETGETAGNTDGGILHATVEENGANFDISFYSDSNKPASSLVAKATNIGAAAAFTATERNDSGLSITGTTHASIADGNTSTVDLNVFSKDGRTDGDPDRFEIVVTETSIGKGQIFLAERFAYYMNSDVSGGETVAEAYFTRGGDLLIP